MKDRYIYLCEVSGPSGDGTHGVIINSPRDLGGQGATLEGTNDFKKIKVIDSWVTKKSYQNVTLQEFIEGKNAFTLRSGKAEIDLRNITIKAVKQATGEDEIKGYKDKIKNWVGNFESWFQEQLQDSNSEVAKRKKIAGENPGRDPGTWDIYK